MITKLALATVYGLVTLSGPAQAEEILLRHELKAYPKQDGATCAQTAPFVKAELERTTGLSVIRVVCAGESAHGFDFVATYGAQLGDEVLTTDHERDPQFTPGTYATQADCQAALPRARDEFVQATQLPVAVAYCRESVETESDPWYVRVDAVGTPIAAKPFHTGAMLWGQPVGVTEAAIVESVVSKLRADGVVVGSAKLRTEAGLYHLSLQYFATQRFDLATEQLVTLDDAGQCEEQTVELNAALAQTRGVSAPLETFCTQSMSLFGPKVTVITKGPVGFATRFSDEAFASYAACLAARAELIQFERESADRPIFGALCGKQDVDRNWRVALVEGIPTP